MPEFTDLWRLVNIALSVPLLVALIYTTVVTWKHTPLVEDKLFVLGTLIMLVGNAMGFYLAWQLEYPFNAIGEAFFSVAGAWLSASVALRIRHMRIADKLIADREAMK